MRFAVICFILVLSLIALATASDYNSPLTYSIADFRYCRINGNCNISTLNVVNTTITNINTTNMAINRLSLNTGTWMQSDAMPTGAPVIKNFNISVLNDLNYPQTFFRLQTLGSSGFQRDLFRLDTYGNGAIAGNISIGGGAKICKNVYGTSADGDCTQNININPYTNSINFFSSSTTTSISASGNYVQIPNLNNTGNAYIGSDLQVTGNFHVLGNFSAKRPYFTGYDNSTQNFLNVANSQVMNVTNNDDFDNYLIHVLNHQNITFELTGDYRITVSPEFYQATGANKVITFWLRKNGVDVPWSNSRYTMSSGEYNAPSITYQTDITNPATDNIQIMWWSDSTSTQIVSISGLTSPTRPSIPGVLLQIEKISEITT